MAPTSTIFQDDYDAACEPQHVDAANQRKTRILDAKLKIGWLKRDYKCISTIDDIEGNSILGLLRKCEHLSDGTLGNFETFDVKLNLREDAKLYHAKAFPVSEIHHNTLKHGKVMSFIWEDIR
jgi:hypothetical protein